MTKTALAKIGLFIGLLALFISFSIGIDGLLKSNANTTNASQTTEGTATIPTASIAELVEEDLDSAALAAACFNFTLDAEIPPDFADEALDPRNYEAAYASGTTISFTYDGPIESAQATCEQFLEQKGWVSLQESSDVVSSYIKDTGTYRSLIVQYLSMDTKTVILVDSTNR